MKRILIATDGSPAATEAVEYGVELAKHEDAYVIFVHVVHQTNLVPMNGFGLLASVPYEPTALDEQVLEDALAIAEREDVPGRTALLRGEPAPEIVRYADLVGADLIVIGSRGHGAVSTALWGSVSRGVLAAAKVPVLVVRAVKTPTAHRAPALAF